MKYYVNRHTDRELERLTHYLLLIAPLDKISHLDHKQWEEHVKKNKKTRE
jgi:hypothetical protein